MKRYLGYGQAPSIDTVIKKLKNEKPQTEFVILEQKDMENIDKQLLIELHEKYGVLIQKTKNKIIITGELSTTPPTDMMIYDAELRIYKQIVRDLQKLTQ